MVEEGMQAVRSKRSGRNAGGRTVSARSVDYVHLRNRYTPQTIFSDDEVAAIHDTALRVLEELGVRVLLPEARKILTQAGAIVDQDSLMVRVGREMVAQALSTAPRKIAAKGGSALRDVDFQLGNMTFVMGCGAPNVTDLDKGRRAGALADFENLTKLTQAFDVLHILAPFVEPQDVDLRHRHYATGRSELVHSDKLPFIFSRGTRQVEQSFEMIKLARSIDDRTFADNPHCYTIINTNSPRQLDIPMARGIIDFARHGQISIITPFCLAGAMAPISVAGALTLQHAEALLGITLAQLVKPGAPVIYGSFSSNVDMKSGAPAFGTPEHVKATQGAGQLARYIGLPWRSGAGSAANVSDAQAAHETQFALWGSVLAGATVCIHAAGWVEGGLAVSMEKVITDVEALQTFAELFQPVVATPAEIAFDAIADVQPGGHFFATQHTMERYRTAFYNPLVADLSNFGNWTESGSKTATERANGIWKRKIEELEPIDRQGDIAEALDTYIAQAKAAGGADPES